MCYRAQLRLILLSMSLLFAPNAEELDRFELHFRIAKIRNRQPDLERPRIKDEDRRLANSLIRRGQSAPVLHVPVRMCVLSIQSDVDIFCETPCPSTQCPIFTRICLALARRKHGFRHVYTAERERDVPTGRLFFVMVRPSCRICSRQRPAHVCTQGTGTQTGHVCCFSRNRRGKVA